jgi:hypothetical protein
MFDPLHAALAHCVGQLSEEQVWARPGHDLNAIGNLILHLTGNVRQLIVCGVGGEPDDRDRPAEFAARGPIPKAELLRRLSEIVDRAKATVALTNAESLCHVRRVKTNDWTGLQAIVRSVAHFRGHTQEIIHMTRAMLGDRYKFAGQR